MDEFVLKPREFCLFPNFVVVSMVLLGLQIKLVGDLAPPDISNFLEISETSTILQMILTTSPFLVCERVWRLRHKLSDQLHLRYGRRSESHQSDGYWQRFSWTCISSANVMQQQFRLSGQLSVRMAARNRTMPRVLIQPTMLAKRSRAPSHANWNHRDSKRSFFSQAVMLLQIGLTFV
jgi:hypothetical protein